MLDVTTSLATTDVEKKKKLFLIAFPRIDQILSV